MLISGPDEYPRVLATITTCALIKSSIERHFFYLTSYLIFVTNAANAVRVKFLAECKKNLEKTRKLLFWAQFISY